MPAGKLASVLPAATTNTFLYRTPITGATSSVLNVINQTGTAATYRVGLRDYDQILTLDSASYNYRRGNVVSSYVLQIIPGITKQSLTAGTLVPVSTVEATFKFLDVKVDTSIKEIPTQTACIGSVAITSAPTGGTVDPGDTITGAKGFTCTAFTYNATGGAGFTASIPKLSTAATSVYLANSVNPVANDYLAIYDTYSASTTGYELVRISALNTTTNIATIQRAQLGTTARAISPGSRAQLLKVTATTTTLSAGITDTETSLTVASATGLTVGDFLRIGNELMSIDGVVSNTVTVTRGQLGTTAAVQSGGATVTLWNEDGFQILQYFDSGEALTIQGGGTATLNAYSSTQNPFGPTERFIFDVNENGVFEDPSSVVLDVGRTYRFLQSDASNATNTLRFKASGSSTDYTTGVTVNGTAGTTGAYTQLVVTSSTSTNLEIYAGANGTVTNYGFGLVPVSINTNPTYNQIYVYDVDGTLEVGHSFATSTGTQDVEFFYPAPYGYVHSYSGTSLKISLGNNSPVFQTSITTTVTGSNGTKTITVGSASNLAPGMSVSGTGIATNAKILSISGTTVTLDTTNTGAVSGTGTFKFMFYDTPRENGSNRNYATCSTAGSSTAVNQEDYIVYDKSLAASSVDKHTGLVIGPGQSVVVYASAATVGFVLNGFEDNTSDFTTNLYNRT